MQEISSDKRSEQSEGQEHGSAFKDPSSNVVTARVADHMMSFKLDSIHAWANHARLRRASIL